MTGPNRFRTRLAIIGLAITVAAVLAAWWLVRDERRRDLPAHEGVEAPSGGPGIDITKEGSSDHAPHDEPVSFFRLLVEGGAELGQGQPLVLTGCVLRLADRSPLHATVEIGFRAAGRLDIELESRTETDSAGAFSITPVRPLGDASVLIVAWESRYGPGTHVASKAGLRRFTHEMPLREILDQRSDALLIDTGWTLRLQSVFDDGKPAHWAYVRLAALSRTAVASKDGWTVFEDIPITVAPVVVSSQSQTRDRICTAEATVTCPSSARVVEVRAVLACVPKAK